jgi:glutamate formiminotransferase
MAARVKLFECVPNISEGRDAAIVEACAQAIVDAGATLAHRTSDPVHHRSVFTFFGSRGVVLEAAAALARAAAKRIDLRSHRGEHPRIGALDVLPFVPLGDATMEDAVSLAREAAARIWAETRIPCYLYGGAATREEHRHLATVRSGEFEGLGARPVRAPGPDVGDVPMHESAGAIAVGARDVLVAFNVVLRTGDLHLARRIARTLRERDGGLRTLRALAFRLDEARVQVSFNVTDHAAVPLDLIVELVRRTAARHGVAVEAGELIGLLPRAALQAVAARRLGLGSAAEVSAPSAQ